MSETPSADPPPLVFESALADDVEALLAEKDKKGELKFKETDRKAVLSVILLEVARREALHVLTLPGKVELAKLLDEVGIDENTDPARVGPLVQRYFTKLNANQQIFKRLERLMKKHTKVEDKLEGANAAAAAYAKLTEATLVKAPTHDEAAPEGSKQAQTLAQHLGVKVRI